jgi:hypothetical protein
MDFFNSKECEWADMSVAIGGKTVTKIRGIQYKSTQDKELLHAAGSEPISTQSGNKTYSGTLKLLKGALDDLNRAAKIAVGQSPSATDAATADVRDIQFDLLINFRAAGSRTVQTDILKGVSITEYEKGWDQGAKLMEISLPFLFERIVSS